MFKYQYVNKHNVLWAYVTLILFLLIFTYLQLTKDKVFDTNTIYLNKDHYYFLNTIYLSILIVLLLIIVLNRHIFLISMKPLLIFICFSVVIYFLIHTNSLLIFFIMYELLLILTSVIVYFNSQNIRAKTITIYFVLWTQLSSFFLWLAVAYIINHTNSYLFTQLNVDVCSNFDKTIIKYLLIISFSIKLPLWPFSFWLIKTHVEANTSFSIFLSGVLVKTALIGLIKFNVFFINTNCTLIFTVITLSIIFTTFAINTQVDFKKLIAYTTVQEMSLITFFVLFNEFTNLHIMVYFIWLHTFTSILLFLVNDSIYIRFKSRKTKLLFGLAVTTPKLNTILILVWIFFISLPLSFKFIFEVILLLKFFSLPNLIVISLLLCLQFYTLIFFTINVVPYSFGNGLKVTNDLTRIELIIYVFTITLLIFLVL